MGSVGDADDNAMAESFFATWSASCWTATSSASTPRPAWPSSTSSKASTPAGGILPSASSALTWQTSVRIAQLHRTGGCNAAGTGCAYLSSVCMQRRRRGYVQTRTAPAWPPRRGLSARTCKPWLGRPPPLWSDPQGNRVLPPGRKTRGGRRAHEGEAHCLPLVVSSAPQPSVS